MGPATTAKSDSQRLEKDLAELNVSRLLSASLRTKGLLGLKDISRLEIEHILDVADEIDRAPANSAYASSLAGKVLLYAFFEGSTRTRMSFESAMLRLGGKTMGFADDKMIRAGGFLEESFEDTVRMLQSYADAIVIRHPQTNSADVASTYSKVPIINAGDGSGEHPTQVLTDLLTVRRKFGTIDGLRFAFIGDGRMRAMHSLGYALSNYDVDARIFCIDELMIPENYLADFEQRGLTVERVSSIEAAIKDADVICMNTVDISILPETLNQRFQIVREDGTSSFKLPSSYTLDLQKLRSHAKGGAIVLHTLPRREELATDIDDTQYAEYWEESRLGVPLRMAILHIMLSQG